MWKNNRLCPHTALIALVGVFLQQWLVFKVREWSAALASARQNMSLFRHESSLCQQSGRRVPPWVCLKILRTTSAPNYTPRATDKEVLQEAGWVNTQICSFTRGVIALSGVLSERVKYYIGCSISLRVGDKREVKVMGCQFCFVNFSFLFISHGRAVLCF